MNAIALAAFALMSQAAQPPLLSTAPTPPAGAFSEPTQMSGMPLQVGDLPPGTVAVRVIRQSFANNVVGQAVELQVLGAEGLMLEERTDAAGRATFRGLPIGRVVLARASLDGEALMSQQFELPAQGGVRLVLVAGVGAGSPGAGAASMIVSAASAATPAVAAVSPAGAASASRAQTVAASLLALVTIAAGLYWSRPRRRHPVPTRDELFEGLVALEHAHADGRIAADVYAARRTALMDELVERELLE